MILLDSSILIEYIKGKQTDLLEAIIQGEYRPCINHIIYSEFLFHFLRIQTNKAPLTLKKNNEISLTLSENNTISFFDNFRVLEMGDEILFSSYEIMQEYNLLPNDALILATCKYYDIRSLVSYDFDFQEPCRQEKIKLVKSIKDLKEIPLWLLNTT